MAARVKGRALTYLRRSTTRQEISLEAQLGWALGEAQRHGVSLDATVADLGSTCRRTASTPTRRSASTTASPAPT